MWKDKFILFLEDFVNFPVFYTVGSHVYMKPIQRMR